MLELILLLFIGRVEKNLALVKDMGVKFTPQIE